MVLSDDRITSFVIKTLNGKLTESDKFYLAEWLENSVKNQTFFNRYSTKEYLSAELEKIYAYDEEAGWQKFLDSNIFVPPIRKKTKWQKWIQSILKIFIKKEDAHIGYE
jgi:hypothetical protein